MEYINGVMNYSGSKFKLLEQIIPELDLSKKYFCDLFTGSFVVGANVVHLYDKILANDIIEDIIKIHKKLIYDTDDFIKEVKDLSIPCKTNQEKYNELRNSYNENKTPEKLYALMLSCMSNMVRWNLQGCMNQSWGRRAYNINTENKIDILKKHIEPHKDKLFFISKNFYDVKIQKPSMIYIDPPYSAVKNEDGTISNKKISEAGYSHIWNMHDDIKLYEYCLDLNKNNSSFMLSSVLEHNNNIAWLPYKLINHGFRYKNIKHNYNKVSKKGNKNTKEVIVMNY